MIVQSRAPASAPAERRLRIGTLAALVAVAIGQLGDLLTFIQMVDVAGTHAELNPLVAHIAGDHGVWPLIVLKLALIVFVVACFAIVARPRPRLAASVVTFATLAGLLGALSNVLTIL